MRDGFWAVSHFFILLDVRGYGCIQNKFFCCFDVGKLFFMAYIVIAYFHAVRIIISQLFLESFAFLGCRNPVMPLVSRYQELMRNCHIGQIKGNQWRYSEHLR